MKTVVSSSVAVPFKTSPTGIDIDPVYKATDMETIKSKPSAAKAGNWSLRNLVAVVLMLSQTA